MDVVTAHRLSLWLPGAIASALMLAAPEAEAGQGSVPNPPAAMAPGQTNTPVEIGASINGNLNPDAAIPAFNLRIHIPGTGRIGQLSGLFIGFSGGPAVNFYGRGIRYGRDYRDIWGHAGFEIGYEIDPWSNLALTISPVIHNDFHFSPYFFQFVQTFGPAIRLYIEKHWVIYFEPGLPGWNVWADIDDRRDDAGFGFSLRGGFGFAYKF